MAPNPFTKPPGAGPPRDMLDLERDMGAAVEDAAVCVVFERFMGLL
jgi:hypothetical protein